MSRAMRLQPKHNPLSHKTAVRIVGEVSDAKAVAIIASGAIRDELEQAVAWACLEDDVMGKQRRTLTGIVAELYEILTADEADEDERD